MARLSGFFLAALSLLATSTVASDSAVLDLIPSNFDNVVLKSGKPGLVEFYAPWCGHCRELAPIFEEVGQAFAAHSDKVHISKVDADAHRSLGKRYGVQGFPTIKWFDGKSDKPEEYVLGRDLESFVNFIKQKTGLVPKGLKKRQNSNLQMLTDQTFNKEIGGDKDVFVAFTASWCGHCKKLAPTWEGLANDFALEKDVMVAKVDASEENSKATAKSQGVSSYPTIKFYPRGSKVPELYKGGRTEQEFINFLNQKAGTHRAIGGGLNDKAGTIESLDSIVAKYVDGSDLATIVKELKTAVAPLKEAYAQYYVRVASKVQGNARYVKTELERLEKLISKGNLAAEKSDDLVSRRNILRRYLGEKSKDEL